MEMEKTTNIWARVGQWLRRPQVWGFAVSVAVIAIVSIAFFYPDNIDGNSLRQADMMQGAANGHEGVVYEQQTGEKALWSNSLFSGMPAYQISPSYPSNSLFTSLNDLYGFKLPAPSNLLFMMMFGFLILMFAMGMQWYYALIGSLAWGFSSYFVIIIGAGHIWKFVTLCYIPPTIAGLVLAYRGKYLAGGALTALFAMLQLNANHPQMSYYFAWVMAALVIAWLVEAVRKGQMRRWLIASAVVLGAGTLAICANLPSIYHTYEYSKETKRADSELTPLTPASAEPASRPTGGMPYDQIVGWSYGKSESFSLLIPNIKGGASAKPIEGQMAYYSLNYLDEARPYDNTAAATLLNYMPQYYNDSEGTNGPVYVGAAVCLLFLIGCFIIKGPVKWALVVVTILSLLLSWGKNMEWLTDIFIYNVPLYNKFRAVESILVIAEFTMPLLAIMALHRMLSDRQVIFTHRRHIIAATVICGVLCLAAWLVPSIYGDAVTASDAEMSLNLAQQYEQYALQSGYSAADAQQLAYQVSLANPDNLSAVETLRYGLTRADGLRSLLFVLVVAGAILGFYRGWCKRYTAVAIVGIAILIDLFAVDKRYVDSDSFVEVTPTTADFTPDAIDNLILTDTTYYRVLDIPGFQRPDRSYFHHCIGGYHAAKLRRYEDLIQRQLNYAVSYGYLPELRIDSIADQYTGEERQVVDRLLASYRVLDMLNARYIITGEQGSPVLLNPDALGNAWLVDSISYVDNADAEMAALNTLNPASEAVADSRFASVLGSQYAPLDSSAAITLTSYSPNRLRYRSHSGTDAIAVFSEVYYPHGWHATIDGAEVPVGRVNYLLRAIALPAGDHEVELRFDPQSLHTTGTIATIAIILIYLLALLAIADPLYYAASHA